MKKGMTVLLGIAAALGLAMALTFSHQSRVKAMPTQTQQPFTLRLSERHVDGSGNVVDSRTKLVAIREDGTRATVDRTKWTGPQEAIPSGVFEQRIVVNQQTGTLVAIYPALKLMTTTPLSTSELQRYRLDAQRACPFNEAGWGVDHSRDQMVAGRDAVFQSKHETTSKFVRTIEEWRSPSLGCLKLRSHETFTASDDPSKTLQQVFLEAETVENGTPPESLFEIPQDYKEAAPSAVLAALEKLKGRECSDCILKTGSVADENYLRHRSVKETAARQA